MRWDVDPTLVDFGLLEIRWYGVLFAGGVLCAATVFPRLCKRRGYPEKDASAAVLWILLGMVLGAHLLHLAFYEPRSFIDNPIRIIQLGYGLASHGAVLGAALGLWLFCRKRGVPFRRYADPAGMACAWVIPFIRTGNFFNSEIIGRPTELPWGVVFAQRGYTEPRHPAQLYEALVGVGLIALTYWLERRRDRFKPGVSFCVILLLYFCARFLIEFVKQHQVLDESAFITMGQWLSLPVIAVTAYGIVWCNRRPEPDDRHPHAE
jgi:prolipoprotein diacylglyceryl transferase